MLGTAAVVSQLREEGFALTKSRLESLLATGRVESPSLVGTSRVWSMRDVARVRRALVLIDGEAEDG